MRRRDRSAAADGGTAWRAFPIADGGTAWSQRRRTTSPYKVADTQTSREVKDTPERSTRAADATNVTPPPIARRSEAWPMAEFSFTELHPFGHDDTAYRKIADGGAV